MRQLNKLIIGQVTHNNDKEFNLQSLLIKFVIREHLTRRHDFLLRIGVHRTQAGSIQANGPCRKMAKVSSLYSEREIIKDRGQETLINLSQPRIITLILQEVTF